MENEHDKNYWYTNMHLKNIPKYIGKENINPDSTVRNTTSKNMYVMKMRKSNQNRIAQIIGEGWQNPKR